jgi:CTP synthase
MLEKAGLHFVGCDETGKRMEVQSKHRTLFLCLDFHFSKVEPACTYEQIVELQGHPFYVGVQFHPEFKSRPRRPSPPFTGFFFGLYWKS